MFSVSFFVFFCFFLVEPFLVCSYGEFIATAIQARMSNHCFDNLFHAASFSDSGSNCVVAKGLLTPNDAEPCFNHNLKNVVDDVLGAENVEPLDSAAAADFQAVALIIAFIRGSMVVRQSFASAIDEVGESQLEMISWNITRWEGRVLALRRFLLMKDVLTTMHNRGVFAPMTDKLVSFVFCIWFHQSFFFFKERC